MRRRSYIDICHKSRVEAIGVSISCCVGNVIGFGGREISIASIARVICACAKLSEFGKNVKNDGTSWRVQNAYMTRTLYSLPTEMIETWDAKKEGRPT